MGIMDNLSIIHVGIKRFKLVWLGLFVFNWEKKTFQTVDPNRTPSRSQVFVYL